MGDPTKMVDLRKQESIDLQKMVVQAILMMVDNHEIVTFPSVMKKTKVSKFFLYNTPEIRLLIELHRSKPKKIIMDERDNLIETLRSQINKQDELIEKLRSQINRLEKKIQRFEQDELWKDKCHKLLAKISELEKQLQTAYKF